MVPSVVPMIKTSPQDEPDFDPQFHHNPSSTSPLMHPLTPWYSDAKTTAASGAVKDVAAWPATVDERAQSVTAFTSSALFGSLSNVVKVEDSSFNANDTALSLPSSSSSSSSSSSLDHLKRDLLVQRG